MAYLQQHRLVVPSTSSDLKRFATRYFCCPLTGDLMADPVITRYGHCYEKASILRHIESHGTDPAGCNMPLRNCSTDLVENALLRNTILSEGPRILGVAVVPKKCDIAFCCDDDDLQ
jgi:hypothetical protein